MVLRFKENYEVEVWGRTWSYKLKFVVEVGGESIRFKIEISSKKLKNLKVENLRLKVKIWSWSLKVGV